MTDKVPVSLVIPVFNEENTIEELVKTIKNQSVQPAEIIIVDGGSEDKTVELATKLWSNDERVFIIEAGRAMPGRGRNIGAARASHEWIAFTDAGIKLDSNWLKNLMMKSAEEPGADIIYGNFSPQQNSFFDKCATIAYVPPIKPGSIRTKSIATCMLKKNVWEKTGGFPDWRATEDLVFMEKAEQLGFQFAFAPDAIVYWKLRPGLTSTYKKFALYSKYNVWAGRQAYWHYGVARQWAAVLLAIIAAILFRWYWILFIPVWMIARAVKRIIMHRHEFGLATLFNPAVLFLVIVITLAIDLATFSGWLNAIFHKKSFAPAMSQLPGDIQ